MSNSTAINGEYIFVQFLVIIVAQKFSSNTLMSNSTAINGEYIFEQFLVIFVPPKKNDSSIFYGV